MIALLFLVPLFCKIFPISPGKDLEVFMNLSDKTVVLVKTTIMLKNTNTLAWSEADPSIPLETSLKIFKSSGLASAEKKELFKDKKYTSHNVFFFTSYQGSGFYAFEFDVKSNVSNNYGLQLEIFQGNPRNSEIISGIDYELSVLSRKIENILSFARQNFELEKIGEIDEAEYVSLYNYMFSLIYKIYILKILVLCLAIFYFNKNLHKFFIGSKLAK